MNKFKNLFSYLLVLLILFNSSIVFASNSNDKVLISHAGGAYDGFRYTNSLEALENSVKNGFKYIELDFNWTKDGVPVLIHDWDAMVKRLFKIEPKVLTHKEFKSLETFQNLTLLDIHDLINFLKNNPEVRIVTDVKNNNIGFLKYVKELYPEMVNRFIPQIYSRDEYGIVKSLGYEDIIYTLYKSQDTDLEVLKFAINNELFAITLPLDRATTSGLPQYLKDIGVYTYAHTINDLYIYENLYGKGVQGIYTDYFVPKNFPFPK